MSALNKAMCSFIDANYLTMTSRELAEQLGVNEKQVIRYLAKKNTHTGPTQIYGTESDTASQTLKKKPVWAFIREQFTSAELDLFLSQWDSYISQFGEDVLHSEESQVIDVIKLDILLNRVMIKARRIEGALETAETDLINARIANNAQAIEDVSRRISALHSTASSIISERDSLLKNKNLLLDKLKATRESRIKDLDGRNINLVSYFRNFYSNNEYRKELGEYIEKMRIATEVEFERLSQPVMYEDHEVDRPILIPQPIDSPGQTSPGSSL